LQQKQPNLIILYFYFSWLYDETIENTGMRRLLPYGKVMYLTNFKKYLYFFRLHLFLVAEDAGFACPAKIVHIALCRLHISLRLRVP
jgi:hypothetical protein